MGSDVVGATVVVVLVDVVLVEVVLVELVEVVVGAVVAVVPGASVVAGGGTSVLVVVVPLSPHAAAMSPNVSAMAVTRFMSASLLYPRYNNGPASGSSNTIVSMRELLDVLDAAEGLNGSTEPYVVATVVATSGSTYRSPGARQLITDSENVGTVSGGCLDSQVRATAAEVMADGVPRLEVYDLTKDDDLVWGWGLGCSGITEVLFEPAASFSPLAAALRAGIGADSAVQHVTLLDGELGRRWILGVDELGDNDAALHTVFDTAITGPVDLDGTRAFAEVVQPPNRLVVCGASSDAMPLVDAAAALGWRVIVTDPRPRLLTEDRFPTADLLVSAEPSAIGTVADLDDRTFAVLMSHNFIRDGDALVALLGSDVAYVGLLGPSERAQQLIKYATEQGVTPSTADLAKLHGPAGLDIGAEGPLEIAWSIMSEMMAVARKRAGGSMRDR